MRKTRVKSLFRVLFKRRGFSLKKCLARTLSSTSKKPVVAASNPGLCSSQTSQVFQWCARGDLNLHPLRDQILSLACLPFHHARSPDGGKDATPLFKLKPAFRRSECAF